ncbi:MAG: HEAT repeat domain-containing protein [Pyrinomonadaceae bacterium]
MKGSTTLSTLAAFAFLLGAIIACSSSGAPTNRLLENLLSASTDEKFNEQFYIHGPVREEELPAIFEATTSRSDYRRRNGASLLCTTLKGNAAELQQRVILETKYVELWAIELDCTMDRDESLAGKRPEMIKAALEDSNPRTLAVGLRAATLSKYPGAHEQARKYLDHKDAKVRAAAVSGLSPEDVRELLPRLKQMIAEENEETTFILIAKSLVRTNDAEATDIVVKQLEQLKAKRDTLWLHFFNDLALFTAPDPMITKLLFALARGQNTLRDEAFSVFSRWVWSKHLDPKIEFVQMCVEEIKQGNLSTDPRRRPEAKPEQEECEHMLSYMHDGKNPVDNFSGRIRGKDAVEFAEKWIKESDRK